MKHDVRLWVNFHFFSHRRKKLKMSIIIMSYNHGHLNFKLSGASNEIAGAGEDEFLVNTILVPTLSDEEGLI